MRKPVSAEGNQGSGLVEGFNLSIQWHQLLLEYFYILETCKDHLDPPMRKHKDDGVPTSDWLPVQFAAKGLKTFEPPFLGDSD